MLIVTITAIDDNGDTLTSSISNSKLDSACDIYELYETIDQAVAGMGYSTNLIEKFHGEDNECGI